MSASLVKADRLGLVWGGLVRGALLLLATAGGAHAENGPGATRQAFYLSNELRPAKAELARSVLARELYRQALLIAARDGLKLQTRDGSLREWGSGEKQATAWSFLPASDHLEVFDDSGVSIWSLKQPANAWWPTEVFAHLDEMEGLSRADFVELLKEHGFEGSAVASKPGGTVPRDAETRLGNLEEMSQFALIRDMHALIRSDGESEARLGILVRAYANLGQLTRYHWSIEHQVYAARALLYAQRMVANDPNSSAALWHRAYALAMAGFQSQALLDLEDAKLLAKPAHAPLWVGFIEPFCKYDFRQLQELAGGGNGPNASIAKYLAYLAVENSGCQMTTLSAAQEALNANPHCLRLIDGMSGETGPGLLNSLVETGPQLFSTMLGTELEKLPGFPEPVTRKIHDSIRPGGNPEGREMICQELVAAGSPEKDPGEPSWAALSRLIQETTFAQVRLKADLIATKWGVDASDYVNSVRPLVKDHPLKGMIDAYGAYADPSPEKQAAAMKSVEWKNLTAAELPAYVLEYRLQSHRDDKDYLGAVRECLDFCSFDQLAYLKLYNWDLHGGELDEIAAKIRIASAENPACICAEIQNQWDAGKAAEWEQMDAGFPSIQLALGKKYSELGQEEDAVRCIRRYIVVSPDHKGYQALADVYSSEQKEDQWLATLQEFLDKTEAIGLEHAMVQVEIAKHFISKQRYADAVPYADAAGATGSAWGLLCAARAHTGIKDFDRAEQLIVEECEHYSYSPFDWVTWCVETGHGHRADAVKAFGKYLQAQRKSASSEDLLQTALIDMAEGKTAAAIAGLEKRMASAPGPNSLMHIAVLADEINDTKTRDAALQEAPSLKDGKATTTAFVNELVKAYRGAANEALDLEAVDALLSKAAAPERTQICVLTARYLMKHGKRDEAIGYVRKGYTDFDGYIADRILLYQTSREVGVEPLSITMPEAAK